MELLSPALSLPKLRLYRCAASPHNSGSNETRRTICCAATSTSMSWKGICRRNLMLFGVSSLGYMLVPSPGYPAEEEVTMKAFTDEINACEYLYPAELITEKYVFKWIESRKPERYSSAAPLSPDARLRIVSERVDFIDNLIISVSIGPPNVRFLKSNDKTAWAARDVADSVLSDKSALRVTSSQRMEESSVLDSHAAQIDGEPYWYCEYLVRKSPTKTAQYTDLYRHYISSTAERDGYLFSLSASTLNKQWDKMGPLLKRTVESFRLLPPSDNYVPPFKDPWRFW